MCTNMPAASTTQCQLGVGPQRVAQQQELSRVDRASGIADTPVKLSTRLREANDSWSAIKRRLKGGFVALRAICAAVTHSGSVLEGSVQKAVTVTVS